MNKVAVEIAQANSDVIEKLAQRLRKEGLSGYDWNVPATWEEAHPVAREAWRQKARQLIVQRLGDALQ